MIRFKYVPDGWVYINDKYIAQFEDFDADCTALNITNPLEKGRFLLYTPPRNPKDRDRGLEYICSEGMHTPGDDVANPVMQKIIDYVDNFVAQRKS